MTKAPPAIKIIVGGAFMQYDIYKQARNAAWEFLIKNNVTQLPVSLSAICAQNGIILLRDNLCIYLNDNDRGATYLRNGVYSIVLNSSDPVQVQRYTTAHELGHIYLKHPMKNGRYGRTFGVQREPKSPMEYQAERFAIDILAPSCVLYGLNLHTAEEISKVCNISMRSAEIRAERMKLLYQRNMFLSHPLEREVFKQFSKFMENKQIF